MALTDAQIVACRRWMGYPLAGSDPAFAYPVTMPGVPSLTLEDRLDNLTSAEETALTERFLDTLPTLEQAVIDAGANLDTETAGPWKANRREVSQRTALYNQQRRAMCAFLGFAPGPALGDGGMTLVRC